MTYNIPVYPNKKDTFKWLVAHKSELLEAKKAQIKNSDCTSAIIPILKSEETKADVSENNAEKTEILVTAIINTTNLLDTYGDVHINGIWDKDLKENNLIMHVQEHKMEFDKIISDQSDLKVYTKLFRWKDLGFKYEGTTQALVFESNVRKERNPYMFKQYSSGYVKNHSVAMRYVDYEVAINDPEFKEEYEAWLKYYPDIANKDTADSIGYFFAITEGKIIEGSAVPRGANYATPTLNVKSQEKSNVIDDIYKKYKNEIRNNRITILRLT